MPNFIRRGAASLLQLRHLYLVEAVLIGVFFIQALRFLVGSLYSRLGSASAVAPLDPARLTNIPGIVPPEVVSSEISLLVYLVALPLLAVILGRLRWLMLPAVALVAVGRALMVANDPSITPTVAASLVLGGGLLYIALLIRHRAGMLPYLFIFGLGIDQVFRAIGNTFDPSTLPNYYNIQVILSLIALVLSFISLFRQQREARAETSAVSADYGLLTVWGGLGLGALLFVELALLALPNAVVGRAGVDYTVFVPFVLAATLLPSVPAVRSRARNFIALFDAGPRGWSWMLLVALLIVFGTRFQGIIAGVALVIAQFAVSLMWWWLVRPQTEKERNFSGLWLVGTVLIFALLLVFDNFTYEYAFVRNFAPPLAFLNNFVTPLLRGFRGMGLAVLLLGVFLAAVPMARTQKRIPWGSGSPLLSLFALIVVTGFSVGAATAARPPVVAGVRSVESVRVATYNLHNGYSEFYDYDLEQIAQTIQASGANVVLLQQVEAGRLTSFGVDQPLWLARRLGMDRRFFPTNEGLQGLAVLSKIEIVYNDGNLLTSAAQQTGMQRVQVRPDAGVITIYNTWLGFLVEGTEDETVDDSEQQRQLTEVFNLIASHHPDGILGRTVIGGTFNNVPDSPFIDRMRQTGFSDPFAGLPIELSATFRRLDLPRARLDYLWLRNLPAAGTGVINVITTDAGNVESTASDHRLAFAEVGITP